MSLSVIDKDQYRNILSAFPTGVTVMTCAGEGGNVGMTVSSFNSVSVDPPLILWSIDRNAPSFKTFTVNDYFCVNVLSDDQKDVALQFARPLPDKFTGIDHAIKDFGLPLLSGCAAHLVCKVWNRYDGGDHEIIIGRVLTGQKQDRNPLVFAMRGFAKVDPIH